ncbi:M1 family metallopeptidase [Asticcacaulis sp. BYS171W]|uniref:M1 family metallopeptidase n=1 Tax=Asticcacaulis aquaticus TaxID=2984212 RepID=A0ABT5HVM9_9CAUL|nr:M1 family metallopeptidase [Asticcacaulis aquaticus]
MLKRLLLASCVLLASPAIADPVQQTKGKFVDKFRQLEGEEWPTPTDYRNAAGEPGYRYWQQKVDYKIKASLNEAARSITGAETVTYTNNSPDTLRYVWLLLDQNGYKRNSISELTATTSGKDVSVGAVRRAKRMQEWEGGFNDLTVTGADGQPLKFTVNDTLMRIDLAQPLKSGETLTFNIGWSFPIAEAKVVGGRSGYECFTKPGEDGNCIFLGAQWFPRLAVYSDYEGWHNKAFIGSGEFTLEFGDYDVELTVPADHIISATGELTNASEVLTAAQAKRFNDAKTAAAPIYVVTPDEAAAAEKSKAAGTKTWKFRAQNVRDFAFGSSRKFIWDAQGVKNGDPAHPVVMAMSFFPKEARPLWDAYSTKSIAHTLNVYGKFAFAYPYPTAQSVNGPVGGMEYPMITFNGPRPVKDKKTGELTYTERAKYGLIGVVIHEIGHIWFPMTVNSDERQWTWLDEGINSFIQFQAEKEWDKDFPSRRGEPKSMIEYMLSENQVPIMTNSESIPQFGNNSYGKPAAALTILRETVLGREKFDFAFKEYSRRWQFKRPTPYDFFRTMEEASGTDLDWFWRGWFYSTDHVDIELADIKKARLNTRDPVVEKAWDKLQDDKQPDSLTAGRNTGKTVVETDPVTKDYYDLDDKWEPTAKDKKKYADLMKDADPELKEALAVKDSFYNFTFRNKGGLVMPVILKMDFTDGTSETVRIPAEVWRYNPQQVTWQYVTAKTLKQAEIDPNWETADVDPSNNAFPRKIDDVRANVTDAEELPNRMKDDDVVVTPDSTKTQPKKVEKK